MEATITAKTQLPCTPQQFSSPKRPTKLRTAGTVLVLLAILAPFVGVQHTAAASCRKIPVYTDNAPVTKQHPNRQPAIWIYWRAVGGQPDASRIMVWYNGVWGRERVPYGPMTAGGVQNGIATNNAVAVDSNGWWIYYLSTSWSFSHPFWDNDWRWEVDYCA